MKTVLSILLSLLLPTAAFADAVALEGAPAQELAAIKTRVAVQARQILTVEDIEGAGADRFVGLAMKRFRPAGAIITDDDVGKPLVVARNAPVRIEFQRGALSITAEGRALAAGAVGDVIRVMNIASKITFDAVVVSDSKVMVQS
ncbi:MAG: flagellar basal body P-ring formation protein FlgA [Parvularculaceae bacterium]|nr:flagellar basal body P-ring formation protein FlgA [Parvularculaceae bacterium]